LTEELRSIFTENGATQIIFSESLLFLSSCRLLTPEIRDLLIRNIEYSRSVSSAVRTLGEGHVS